MSGKPPLYARVLRLRHIRPGGLLCFAFFEGAVAVGILLALAELAPWWAALVLPAVVAGVVKVNDVVAGLSARARLVPAHTRAGSARRTSVRGRATAPGALPATEAPGLELGAPTGHIYRHVPDEPQGTDTDGSGEHRRGLNQGRFG